ncbi:MAG: T9SS type A sorting domain-containing protein [bacterium]|nr:T9SS type A sorting domain-containing protein [bacterium]
MYKRYIKKVLFSLIILPLSSFNTYAIHNLKINNATSLEVTTTDTIHITGYVESNGASAKATLYYDANRNGVIDGSEQWVLKFTLIDGNFDDADETKNGAIDITRKTFTITGNFVLYVEDSGISDSVAIQVKPPVSSSYSISGMVTTPANTPNIFVGIIDSVYDEQVLYGTFTDSSGAYSIVLPDVFKDSMITISAMDMLGIVGHNYISNNQNDPMAHFQITGTTIGKNLALTLLSNDTTFVSGTIKDDAGNPLAAPFQIIGGAAGASNTFCLYTKTNSSGYYNYIIKKQNPAFYLTGADVQEQFYPQYLNPLYKKAVFAIGPITITNNITVYRATDSICGFVYKNGTPYKGAQINIEVVYPSSISGGTYTKTYSDGHYTAYVSNTFITYSVKVASKSVPDSFEVLEGDTMKAGPGAQGIDFHLYSKITLEEKNNSSTCPIIIQPNPFVNNLKFELPDQKRAENLYIYDITGAQAAELIPEYSSKGASFSLYTNSKKMPAGVYFYSLKTPNRTYEGKLIKVH